MGDLQEWSPELNGTILEERPSSFSPLSSPVSTSNQAVITAEYWQRAEEATQGIIGKVQPTVVSEERRKAVIDYVQQLIRSNLGCEVYPFGSVPLKTYLPDGDIDLTAFGALNVEEALAGEVCSVLEREDQNGAGPFIVKDVQLIRAEVKLVKCLVQNIVVDISFNQLGGLCTLCFLEQVDRLIGKDHLFKRSILLIKAWCYYESRILGAHHGLISTYALETLVLYIFHLFHSSLNGPLAVLYKFLDYFSKFDWDNYCISLSGPVRISSLPEVVVETPENGGGDLLLSEEFLKDCVEMYYVPSRGFETTSRTFASKHLNIIDPLKESNNLGRSVSKGNFYRIRSAFTYGARKLGHILSQAEEHLVDELHKFFSNTLDRHGSGRRPDVQDPVPVTRHNGYGVISPVSGIDLCQENQTVYESEPSNSSGMTGYYRSDNMGSLSMGVDKKVSVKDLRISAPQGFARGTAVSENRLTGDAKDLATSKIQGLIISGHTPKSSSQRGEESVSSLGKACYAPHLYFSRSFRGNGEMRNGDKEQRQGRSSFTGMKLTSDVLPVSGDETGFTLCSDGSETLQIGDHDDPSFGSKRYSSLVNSVAWSSEDLYRGYFGNQASPSSAGGSGTSNLLSDLTGDYDSQKNSLHYGRWWFEYSLNVPHSSMSSPLVSQFQSKNSWDVVRHSVQFRQNVVPQMNANSVVPRPLFFPMNPPILPAAGFGMEEMSKPRGTGTYFPNTNHYRDRPLTPRGRNQTALKSPRNNDRVLVPSETNFPDRNSREFSQAQFNAYQAGGKSGSPDIQYSSPEKRGFCNANGLMHLTDKFLEFGSIGHLQLGSLSSSESSRQSNSGSSLVQSSNKSLPMPGNQRSKAVIGMGQERVAAQAYQLKDEDDFPPLSI